MKIFSAMFLLFISLLLTAADSPNSPGDRRGGGGRRGGMRGGFRMLEQLKEKYPKEVAEIEKLQASSPEQARSKMFELMRKAGPEMGFGGFRGRRGERERNIDLTGEQLAELKAKFPKEFAEYEKLKESDPRKAEEKLRELAKKAFGEQIFNQSANLNLRDRSRRAVEHVRMELARRYPERYAAIKELERTNPDKARAELRKLFAESNMRMPLGARELNYQYIDPKLNNQFNRPGMMNMRQYPFGNRMMGPGGNNWRR